MPSVALRSSIARIAAIVVSRAAPDVLESLLPGHRPDRATFPLDDGHAHMLGHGTFGQVAISMEVTDDPIDAQAEDTAVTESVRNSRMANIDSRIQSGGRISNI